MKLTTYLIALVVLPAVISAQKKDPTFCLMQDSPCGEAIQKSCCSGLVCLLSDDNTTNTCVPVDN